MSEPSYPLFLVDRDDHLVLVKSEQHIGSELELVDVEDEEYHGWHVRGRPIGIRMKDNRIAVSVSSTADQTSRVRQAIVKHANLVWPDSPFKDDDPDCQLIELHSKCMAHLKKMPFGRKFRLRF